MMDLDPHWGRGRRKRALTPEQVREIRTGSHATDARFAAQFRLSVRTIEGIRLGQRYRAFRPAKKQNDKLSFCFH